MNIIKAAIGENGDHIPRQQVAGKIVKDLIRAGEIMAAYPPFLQAAGQLCH